MREYKIRGKIYKIRYNDFSGELTPIIFIHVEVASILGSKHRIILIDLLGAGYSDKPLNFNYFVDANARYLKEFIEDLNLEKVIIFGHSLGGAVSIELCNLIQDRVQCLILSESNLDPSVQGEASFEIASFDKDNLEEVFKIKLKEYEESGSTMWTATLRNWLPKAAFEISTHSVRGGKISWRELLYSFEFPKYFIFGEKSLPDDDYVKLKEHNIKIEVVPNAGH